MFTTLFAHVSHDTQRFPSVSSAFRLWKANLTKSADRADIRTIATRMAPVQIEEMVPGALEYVIDCASAKMTPWQIMDEEFTSILSRPGPAIAFKELLVSAEFARSETRDPSGVIRLKINEMVAHLIQAVNERLEAYRAILEYNRNRKKGEPKKEVSDRPADIYRTFGLALRYATEELGYLAAREVVREMALETTMPLEELENPDWVCPYTGDGEKGYEPIRFQGKELVSIDGNLSATLAEMLEDMNDTQRAEFDVMLARMGWTLDDYWLNFMEAQRGGYNEVADDIPDQEQPEFDVIEKDFEYKADFETTGGLEALRAIYARELKDLDREIQNLAGGLVYMRDEPAKIAWASKWIAPLVRHSQAFRTFWKFMLQIGSKYEPQDLLALMLPYQHELCISEADLNQIKIPGQYQTLGKWFRTFEEPFLAQFQDAPGRTNNEPDSAELDEYTEDVMQERIRTYLSPQANRAFRRVFMAEEGKRSERLAKAWSEFWSQYQINPRGARMQRQAVAAWKQVFQETKSSVKAWREYWRICNLKGSANPRFDPEYVKAEVMASMLGDGGTNAPFEAGWEAWREKTDAEANAAYHAARREGKSRPEAMRIFREIVAAKKNKVKSVAKDGLTLGSGRKINWYIAKIKIEADEIRLGYDERLRLRNLLRENKFGPLLVAYLTDWLVKYDERFIFTEEAVPAI